MVDIVDSSGGGEFDVIMTGLRKSLREPCITYAIKSQG